MNDERALKILKALSDEKRLKIVKLLSSGTLCACDILKQFEFTQPALSQHMKVLLNSELVKGSREGNWMFYSLDKNALKELEMLVGSLINQDDSKNKCSNDCCE